MRAGRRIVVGAVLGSALLAACEPGSRRPIELRQATEELLFSISSDPSPPHAREAVLYKVVVRDSETRQPIEGGEGRIFATSRDGASTWDGLEAGPELGTYYGTLNFVTAGEWAVAIQFRRDTTARVEGDTTGIQRVDWMQEVRAAREPGEF